MNIFVTDKCPIISAKNLDDKRVRHMPKECIEMLKISILLNTGRVIGKLIIWGNDYREERFHELLYHPCTSWVTKNSRNSYWLWRHLMALFGEYRYRFGKNHYLLDHALEFAHFVKETTREPKGFRNSSGFIGSNVTDCYKKCLNQKWVYTDEIRPVIWTKRNPPLWYDENQMRFNFDTPLVDHFDDYNDDLPF